MLRYKKEIADGAMIHCPKEEDARLLRRYLEAHGCKEKTACNSTSEIADDIVFEIHKDRYYQFDFNHPQIVTNCNYGYHVIEFSDLVFPQELSAKDLLEWLRHLYDTSDYDDAFGELGDEYGLPDLFEYYSSEEIIRRITAYETKRKAKTAKPAKPEWVSICEKCPYLAATEEDGDEPYCRETGEWVIPSEKTLTCPLKSVRFRFTEDVRETYPELLGRSFSLKEIDDIYHRIIDKEEYHSFDDWFFDMARSGLLVTAQDER